MTSIRRPYRDLSASVRLHHTSPGYGEQLFCFIPTWALITNQITYRTMVDSLITTVMVDSRPRLEPFPRRPMYPHPGALPGASSSSSQPGQRIMIMPCLARPARTTSWLVTSRDSTGRSQRCLRTSYPASLRTSSLRRSTPTGQRITPCTRSGSVPTIWVMGHS